MTSSDRARTFPRGLVLGLTMAETAILIIFVLLLALTALLGREAERRRAVEQDLARFEAMRQVLSERGIEPEAMLNALQGHAEDRNDADNWRELVRDLHPSMPEPSPRAIVSRLEEARETLERDAAHRAIDEFLREAGIEPTQEALETIAEIAEAGREAGVTAEEMPDVIDAHRAIDEALAESGAEATPQAVEQMVRDAERWRELAADRDIDLPAALDRARQRIARLEAQARGRGGTDHPSCWYDDDNRVAYLFDVALTPAGYVLRPTRAPQHERQRTELRDELAPIQTGQALSPAQFRTQTQRIYRWSVDNDCRFFVRAFDVTAADQKELYKERMRLLESRFYKYANPSGPPPTAGPAPRL